MVDPFSCDVSFVITVYNKAPYMGPMLRSLERQTGDFSREFIFVDDGSTDNSVEVLKEATGSWPNVKIIRRENGGPSKAFNTGGFEANGEFIKVVDADDVLTPFATERMLELCRQGGVDFLYASWKYSDDVEKDSLQASDHCGPLVVYENPLREFFERGMAGSTNVMMRTSAFREVGGCDDELFVQDVSLPLRFAKKHKMAKVDLLAVLGPREVGGRVQGRHAEMVYTMSASMYHFLRDNPDVASHLQRIAFKRCAGRAWKWAKRNNGKTFFSREFGLYLLSCLPIWRQTASMIGKTIHVWDAEDIRYKVRLPD
ncbi:MAG: glycosyltransferase family 2 protein [Pseudomonadota bacterium]|nr:glycosyltransferase family 2 protein [Pseudomonadota bacterium]